MLKRDRYDYPAAPYITRLECLTLLLILGGVWGTVAFLVYLLIRALKG